MEVSPDSGRVLPQQLCVNDEISSTYFSPLYPPVAMLLVYGLEAIIGFKKCINNGTIIQLSSAYRAWSGNVTHTLIRNYH